MNKKFYWLAGFAALMMTAACSDDNVVNDNPNPTPDPEVNEYVGEMQMYDAASQAGRIYEVPGTRALKSERLSYLGDVDVPTYSNWNWSATSLYYDENSNSLYVTWHSNVQSTNPDGETVPTEWGGGLDVFTVKDDGMPEFSTTGISPTMKFENVVKVGGKLFLAGTQSKGGAGIARIDETNLASGKVLYDIIGFPGSSVNAIAESDNNELVAISGYTGTYGFFAPNVEKGPYYLENGEARDDIRANKASETWGGKYITADGKYLLRDGKDGAVITDVETPRNTYQFEYHLLSSDRSAEKYEVDENGNVEGWELVGGTEAQKYGKHVLVVKGNYAIVAAGTNGLRVHDLSKKGEEVRWQTQDDNLEGESNGPHTTGLYVDDDYLYAATGNGLRVYTIKEDGKLELFAFEVENYNEETGAPQRDEDGNYQPAETETAERHSCNFVVAVDNKEGGKTIYVAYGRSGIRVYKLNPDAAETTKPEN